MRKVIYIAWDCFKLAVCIGVIVVGLSLLGGFVAHQYIDWKDSQSTASNK